VRLLEKLAAGAGHLARLATSRATRANVLGVVGVVLVYRGVEGWSPEAADALLGAGALYLCWAWSR